MTPADRQKMHEEIARNEKLVADSVGVIAKAKAQSAHIDKTLAVSEIRRDEYRRVLRRAGLLKK